MTNTAPTEEGTPFPTIDMVSTLDLDGTLEPTGTPALTATPTAPVYEIFAANEDGPITHVEPQSDGSVITSYGGLAENYFVLTDDTRWYAIRRHDGGPIAYGTHFTVYYKWQFYVAYKLDAEDEPCYPELSHRNFGMNGIRHLKVRGEYFLTPVYDFEDYSLQVWVGCGAQPWTRFLAMDTPVTGSFDVTYYNDFTPNFRMESGYVHNEHSDKASLAAPGATVFSLIPFPPDPPVIDSYCSTIEPDDGGGGGGDPFCNDDFCFSGPQTGHSRCVGTPSYDLPFSTWFPVLGIDDVHVPAFSLCLTEINFGHMVVYRVPIDLDLLLAVSAVALIIRWMA